MKKNTEADNINNKRYFSKMDGKNIMTFWEWNSHIWDMENM